MTMSFNGANGISFSDGTTQNTGASGFGFKNRIINGAMMIDQRYAGSTVTNPNGYNSLDRWVVSNYISTTTAVQSNTAPDGFAKSLFVTTGTSTSPDPTYSYYISQTIEGYNFADFMYGTATAKSTAISFWVRSSQTGTFAVALRNSGGTRSYVTTYTVNASNTWEYKTVVIAGDTSGTWVGATNGLGVEVMFDLGSGTNYNTTANAWQTGNYFRTSGSKSLNSTTGSTFAITGVQLEKGSTATAFDYRSYGHELQLCQRYFSLMAGGGACGTAESSNRASVTYQFSVPMRAAPTGTLNASKGSLSQPQGGPNSLTTMSSFFFGTTATAEGGWCVFDMSGTPWTTGRVIINNGTTGMLQFSAEL